MTDKITIDADVAAWLANLIAGMTVTIGAPDAPQQATMAWRALAQLTNTESGNT